ncbi:MAG: peptidase T [Acidaminococcaceae bacterium]|jgi:tripeptide aminopeptidase|nr:peptidase T [Acidaminococcaceae bacterium]
MKTVVERFLSYIKIDTTSDEDSQSYPSTPNQLILGKSIAEELRELGLEDVEQDKYGYVTATIPANIENVPVLGLIAHLDTSDAVPGNNIKPHISRYIDGDIVKCQGKELIATDGTTLLGADDKAGVAEIITMAERLLAKDAPLHGKIRLCFTPDEEIGQGTKYFDVKKFNADYAYTVDGGPLGELEYENFNAATAIVKITGYSIHPGSAKDKMINSSVLGCDFVARLPQKEQPAHTEGREGFYHVIDITGTVEECTIKIAVRDHDEANFERRKQLLNNIAAEINKEWGKTAVVVNIKDSYYNMKAIIEKHMELIDSAKAAFMECGVEPVIVPIRGGTDGAKLSRAGLPCPNLSTGGYNFHSRFEFIPVEDMETMVEVLVSLAHNFTKM